MCLSLIHILEDIELNVIVARSVLEKLGNSVDVAMTGKAALTARIDELEESRLMELEDGAGEKDRCV